MKTKEINFFAVVVLIIALGIIGTSENLGITGMQAYDSAARGETTLDNALGFLQAFGFFSVILPFLLIFAIVFGILEKTKIFGSEKYKGESVPRKNLNSVVAFCIAFFVVAASNVVYMLQVSLPIVALILVVVIIFMLLFGALMGESELEGGISLWKSGGFRSVFVICIVTAVLAIILAGFGLLDDIISYIGANVTGTFITSIILLIIVIGAMWFVVGRKEGGSKS